MATVAVATGQAPTEYYADTLLRSNNPSAVAPAETELRRGEVLRIVQRSPSGELAPADQTYLGQLVTRQTSLPEADAKARVEAVMTEYRNAATLAQQAAEKARKFALLLAFAVATTLVVSAGAAWWAAVQGGEHRDHRFDLRPYVGWRRAIVSGRS